MKWRIIFTSVLVVLLAYRSSGFISSLLSEEDKPSPPSHSVWSSVKSFVRRTPPADSNDVGPTVAGKAAEAWNVGAQTAEYLAKKAQIDPEYAAAKTRHLEDSIASSVKGKYYSEEEREPSFWNSVKKMYRRATAEEEELPPSPKYAATKLGETWDKTKETAGEYLQRMKDAASDVYSKAAGTTSDYAERLKGSIPAYPTEEDKSVWQKTKEKVSDVYHKVMPGEEPSFFELTPAQEARLRASGKFKQYQADANAIWREAKARMAHIYEAATEKTPEETQWKLMGRAQSLWSAARHQISDLYYRAMAEPGEESWEQVKGKASETGQKAKESVQDVTSKAYEYAQKMKDAAAGAYYKGVEQKDKLPPAKSYWESTKEKLADAYHKVAPGSEDTSLYGLTPAQQAKLQALGKLDQYRSEANKIWRDAKYKMNDVYSSVTEKPSEELQSKLAHNINMIWSQAKDRIASTYYQITSESEPDISEQIRAGPAWEEAKEKAADYAQRVKERAAKLSSEAAERVRETYHEAEEKARQ